MKGKENLIKMEYSIGHVDRERPCFDVSREYYHKFIVDHPSRDKLVFHSVKACNDKPKHTQIAESVRARHVIGGGDVMRDDWKGEARIILTNDSATYGSVPDDLLRRFPLDKLFEIYRQISPDLKKIDTMMCRDRISDECRSLLEEQ